MANLKRLKKDLVKLSEEELKDVLSFMTDEEEVEEDKKEEVVEEEKEVKEEPDKKEEVQSQTVTLSKTELAELLDGVLGKFATKEEVENLSKKNKVFGAKQKTEKVETKEQPTTADLIAKLNSKFV